MAIITFDTLAYSDRLQKGGFPREQAEAIARANADIFEEVLAARDYATRQNLTDTKNELKEDIANLRTELKEDIADVRRELAEVRTELKEDIADVRRELAEVRTELKEDIANLRSELKEEIATSRHEILKWFIGMTVAIISVIIACMGIGIAFLRP